MRVHASQVVLFGLQHLNLPRSGPPVRGHLNAPVSAQVVGRERRWGHHQFLLCSCKDHFSAFRSSQRPHVNDIICGTNDSILVLYDHNGIAQVAQAIEHFDQPFCIVRVEANAGLVQNIGAAHKAAAQTGAQLNALAFSATQSGEARFRER